MFQRHGELTLWTVAALAICCLAGCGGGADTQQEAAMTDCAWLGDAEGPVVGDIEARLADYSPTTIAADLSGLPGSEREALDKLVAAAKIMHDIFREQATPCHDEIAARLDAVDGPAGDAARAYFGINCGPWDRSRHFEPFFGPWEHPEGANYYPLDLTDAEKAQIEDPANGLNGLFTMVRRDESGALEAIPYSEYFADELNRAAGLLREAASATSNESLKAFLEARAAAFLSDDYYESDMLWMDVDSAVEVTIGPYETYEDGIFGYKAAFEAFVTVTDPEESARLQRFKKELPWLESSLPIPDGYKNPNRGSESPIRVVDEVYTGGDTRAGVQTLAFNLPNDERVREAKGSKKVMLRNMMDAKFAQILTPIAERVVVTDQLDALGAESFFLHTLLHEMSHGLGPGRIVVDGRDTEVRLELKDNYSVIEEAKADAMGEWAIFKLQEKGYFPDGIRRQQAVTYLAGLFRSMRFGIGEAHGGANAIQFNYLVEKGAILVEGGRFRVVLDRFPQAVESLVHDICVLQAEGDYEAGQEMVDKYVMMPESVMEALQRLDDVPVDILPQYAYEEQH